MVPGSLKAGSGSDLFDDFLRSRVRPAPSGTMTASEIHDLYVDWCKTKRISPMSPRMLTNALLDVGVERRRSSGKRYYCLEPR